jgi:hypothetical protein
MSLVKYTPEEIFTALTEAGALAAKLKEEAAAISHLADEVSDTMRMMADIMEFIKENKDG